MTSIVYAIALGWTIEAVASSKNVAVSVLHDLIATIPPNLPAKLRRSITERVALRCLEDVFATHGARPVRRSNLSLDFSESCEEVLRRIVNESAESDVKMGGGGRWECNIEQFIKQKRASMPKCALQKLKESIVDGTHRHAELFRRKSGLASVKVDGSDGNLRFIGGINEPNVSIREIGNDRSALPRKRVRIEVKTEKVADEECEDDGFGVNAKKTKRDASCVSPPAAENRVPLAGKQTLECLLERDVPVSEGERCVLSEFRMEMREERLAEDLCVAPSHEAHHEVSVKDSGCNIEHEFHVEVSGPVPVGGSKQKSIADEGKDDSEHLPEPTTPLVAPPVIPQHKVYAKESVSNHEHDSHIRTHGLSADVSQKKNIADGGKDHSQLDYIAMEKRDFLNSKCKFTRYGNSKEKDHCLMCNGGDQLLICSNSDCPFVYHESCMGSKFISYVGGDFYCPFCAYSRHLTEFLEVEKEDLQIRKDLSLYISLLESSS
ncbi:uncharacterized protein LOC126794498 [Argentina anserina]|uniref:uncharacterized protein LOC126794498 n=1 Tax=Argentina anserina TaxID=57926 RepID=UPI0021761D87|nr:uncharacterized protein LOC126794498 [Potentilla anserina]